jgi:phospholipase C
MTERNAPPSERAEAEGPGRRTVLRAGLAGAAGVALAATTSWAHWSPRAAMPVARRPVARHGAVSPAFEHVVVLMLENRSFDQILGWLYRDGGLRPGIRFEGLTAGARTNRLSEGSTIAAYPYVGTPDGVLVRPTLNAGEGFDHTVRQLWGTGRDPDGAPTMSGFLEDYRDNARALLGSDPSLAELRQVMGGFAPDALPVITTLARSFGVFDQWFAAVPSETFCNRAFFHAGTSLGWVSNAADGGFAKWLDAPATPTVFNRLEDAELPWRVYYDESQVVSLTGFLGAPALEPYWQTNFRGMRQFHQDARDGKLPAYAFIEPRMMFDHNSMHPPTRGPSSADPSRTTTAVADMLAAEALIAEVYEAIRTSAAPHGSNAMNTTLVITFDEHGGMYDHVPPPAAVAPEDGAPVGEAGFRFDRLGVRVPAVVVSAYTEAGSVFSDQLDHCSVVSTLSHVHGLAPLTERDAAAAPILAAANRSTPRPIDSWPIVRPARVAPPPTSVSRRVGQRAPTPTGLGLLGLLLARFDPAAPIPDGFPTAFDILSDHGDGLFGVRDLPPL